MTPSFNLIVEPWIPCTDRDGEPVELGIRDVLLHAHELRGLNSDSPYDDRSSAAPASCSPSSAGP